MKIKRMLLQSCVAFALSLAFTTTASADVAPLPKEDAGADGGADGGGDSGDDTSSGCSMSAARSNMGPWLIALSVPFFLLRKRKG